MPPDDFRLRTDKGRQLVLGMRGEDFGLFPGMVLYMFKRETSPPPQQHHHRSSSGYGRLTPPPPAPAAAAAAAASAPTEPAYSQSPAASRAATDLNLPSDSPAASQPPPLSALARSHTPQPLPEVATVAAAAHQQPAAAAAATDLRRCHPRSVSPSRRPHASAGVAARPAAAAPAPIWDATHLSHEQNRMQEKLLAEFEARKAGGGGGGGSTSASSVLHQRHPSPQQGPSELQLEAKIRELRAENAALRRGAAEAAAAAAAAAAASAPATTTTTSAALGGVAAGGSSSGNFHLAGTSSASPAASTNNETWLLTSQQASGRGGSPGLLPQQPQPLFPRGASSPAAASSDETATLARKCRALADDRRALEVELDRMKSEWTGERRQRMLRWEADHRGWAERQQDLIASWEADKALLLNATEDDAAALVRVHEKWEMVRGGGAGAGVGVGVGGSAAGGGEAAAAAAASMRQAWAQERGQLEAEVAALQRLQAQEDAVRLEGRRETRSRLAARRDAAAAEVAGLKQKLSKSRHDTEQNKLFVVAASQSLDDLRGHVREAAAAPADEAKALVNAVTEKAMLALKASTLRVRHDRLHQTLQREAALRKHLHNTLEDIKGCIRSIVRMRPVLPHDLAFGATDDSAAVAPQQVVKGSVTVRDNTVSVSSATAGSREYPFYRALPPSAGQDSVFAEVRPLLQSTIDGFNACIMAYGQTGSGKTYTIMGDGGAQRGILPRSVEELFAFVERLGCEYTISCSMVELYLDGLRDLLDPEQKKCELRQLPTGLSISCADHTVTDFEGALRLLKVGSAQRQVHSTQLNAHSSRSHAVFTLKLNLKVLGQETSSKLSFVDLAGSERVKVSHSTGDRLKEAQMINKSLSALGDVVASLSQRSAARGFVPYRNSKLTMILQEALGGNSKTVLFACICPGESGLSNISETVSTLVFASRVKHVYNPYLRNITRVQNAAIADEGAGGGGDGAEEEEELDDFVSQP